MTGRFEDLVAVASGTAAQVAGWCKLLRVGKVRYVTESSCVETADERPDHVELWVHKDDADRAREILKQGDMGRSF
jgi:hypothetical protein